MEAASDEPAAAAAPVERPEEAGATLPAFCEARHVAFIRGLMGKADSFEHVVMEHLKMSAVYWALMGMALMGRDLEAEMDLSEIVAWVLSCQHDNGGFGGNAGHDPHLLYTLSAIQILAMARRLDAVDAAKVAAYVASLQQPDGSFTGDEWGEVDTRFSYCALSTLAILGKLPPWPQQQQQRQQQSQSQPESESESEDAAAAASQQKEGEPAIIDLAAATAFVGRCRNFDGGFGCVPGAESHAGQVFTCVGALAIGGGMQEVDEQLLGWWLCERQCDSGGLNGRPEKQADVCYSWWILSALSILGRVDWIDTDKLKSFILQCQDQDDGGISDRPGNVADVFHTFFGIAGLSLLGYFDAANEERDDNDKARYQYAHYRPIDPVYALPVDIVRELGLRSQVSRTPAPGGSLSA